MKYDPSYASAYNSKGIALDDLETLEAIENYDLAIKNKPDFAEAYNNKAVSYGKLGKDKEAIIFYDLAIKYKPNFAKAYNNKGASLNT
ncbi:tetratricopeptide repeat protein [Orientia tsutsugamushi]|uniref:tetratricopeptide repeat protein n=1 Tax=Orientia tsutsugamushi TaxID=784 RepID=UPI00339D674B